MKCPAITCSSIKNWSQQHKKPLSIVFTLIAMASVGCALGYTCGFTEGVIAGALTGAILALVLTRAPKKKASKLEEKGSASIAPITEGSVSIAWIEVCIVIGNNSYPIPTRFIPGKGEKISAYYKNEIARFVKIKMAREYTEGQELTGVLLTFNGKEIDPSRDEESLMEQIKPDSSGTRKLLVKLKVPTPSKPSSESSAAPSAATTLTTAADTSPPVPQYKVRIESLDHSAIYDQYPRPAGTKISDYVDKMVTKLSQQFDFERLVVTANQQVIEPYGKDKDLTIDQILPDDHGIRYIAVRMIPKTARPPTSKSSAASSTAATKTTAADTSPLESALLQPVPHVPAKL